MYFVRKALLKDIEKIVQIHVSAWKVSYRGYVSDEILDSPYFEVSEKRINKMKIPVEKGLVYVVEEAGEVKGFLGLDEFKSQDAEIKVFYVDPNMQRKGLGKALFDYVKTNLIKEGVKKINLFTLKEYPVSNAFYQKQGFSLVGNEQFLEWANVMLHEYVMDL